MNDFSQITVAIPAFNEAQTIGPVIDAIFMQRGPFEIEQVLIVCDGSSDTTPFVVKGLAKKNKKIKLISHKTRMGKAQRINQIFALVTSEILFLLDADIFIGNPQTFALMLRHFSDPNVGLVSANNLPFDSDKNIWSHLMATNERLWYEARKDVNAGDCIYNNGGSAIAIRRAAFSQITLPNKTIEDQHFIYMFVKRLQQKFVYEQNAVVLYKTVTTFNDLKKQLFRSQGASDLFFETFHTSVAVVGKVPFVHKLKALVHMMLRDPLYTLIAVLFLKVFTLLSKIQIKKEHASQYLWEPTYSTKTPINI